MARKTPRDLDVVKTMLHLTLKLSKEFIVKKAKALEVRKWSVLCDHIELCLDDLEQIDRTSPRLEVDVDALTEYDASRVVKK